MFTISFLALFFFFAVCCLPITNVILIVFAYLQPTIHTKSTLSWREDCSVLALQSIVSSFTTDWTDEKPISHTIK